jgi:hypothetical protein
VFPLTKTEKEKQEDPPAPVPASAPVKPDTTSDLNKAREGYYSSVTELFYVDVAIKDILEVMNEKTPTGRDDSLTAEHRELRRLLMSVLQTTTDIQNYNFPDIQIEMKNKYLENRDRPVRVILNEAVKNRIATAERVKELLTKLKEAEQLAVSHQ